MQVEDQEIFGERVALITQRSEVARFKGGSAWHIDERVIERLVDRVMADQKDRPGLFKQMPHSVTQLLYKDVISLTLRLLFDIALTFELRCLGHSLTVRIKPDEMLHEAPGWDVALEEGIFGRFDDGERKRWIQDRLGDPPPRSQHLMPTLIKLTSNVPETVTLCGAP